MDKGYFNNSAFATPLNLFSRVTTARSLRRVRCDSLGDTLPLHTAHPIRYPSVPHSAPLRCCTSTAATIASPLSASPMSQTIIDPTTARGLTTFAMSSLAKEREKRAATWARSTTTISKPPTPAPLPSTILTQSITESNKANQAPPLDPAPEQSSEVSPLCAKLTELSKLRSRRRHNRGNALVEERAAGIQYSTHEEYVTDVLSLRGDPLESDGGRIVVFRGNPSAHLMVIGEGPGAEEDRLGLPFVGASGQLLDRVLRYAGFEVDQDVYVTNVVKRRPRQNRDPSASEMAFYAPLLREEIRLVKPDMVVLAGRFAMQALLPDLKSIMKARGRWFPLPGGAMAMPVYHPAFLLRNPDAKAPMQEDALVIREKFLELHPGAKLADVRNQGSGHH